MENKLLNLTSDKELRITSMELVEIINNFRKVESEASEKKYVELRHDSFMAKIKSELGTLKTLGLNNAQNILEVTYEDKKGETRPCYSLNGSGMRMMLNSESTIVRFKTEEYINKLENSVKLISAQKEIKELKSTLEDFKRATEEAKRQFHPCHKRKLDYNKMIKNIVGDNREYVEGVKDMVFAQLHYDKWEDSSTEDNDKIIKAINVCSRFIMLNKFEQLSLF
ncbi:hypothetical protein FDB23_03215 [Clostridium botulinum]|nr:hypothetical protein [Clostridium botulinum]